MRFHHSCRTTPRVGGLLLLQAFTTTLLLALTPPLTSWTSTDLGTPTTAGSASHDTNTGLITLQSEGTGFGGTSDDGFFLHGTLNVGDTLTAQLNAAPSGALGNEQAGLMVRTSLNQDAASLFLGVAADSTVSALWRPADGVAAKVIALPQVSATDWLQLVADADSVTAYFSTDGITFTPLFAVDLPLSDPVYGGLAIASGDASQTATAVFAEADLGPTAFRVDLTLDATTATATGAWNTRTAATGEYLLNSDYLDDLGLTSGTAELEFTPTIPLTGSYEVYARWSSGPDRDTAVPVDITDANSQVTALALDQTVSDGEWVYLGSYDFDSAASGQTVKITNSSTTGLVTLDAIKLIGTGWMDTDADNLPDPWESTFFGNLTTASATSNSDSDSLTDLEELFFDTDPTLADTDGDWIDDDIEANNGLNPLDATHAGLDSDGDGWSDYEESVAGTDPLNINDFPAGDLWDNIAWANLTDTATADVQGIGSTLEKNTTSTAWNAGATSTLFLEGDGEFRFGAASTDTAMFVGLNDFSQDANYTNLDYAFYLNNGGISIFENGSFYSSGGATYLEGDLLSIQRVGSEIRYLLNGTVIYTSTIPSSGDLFVDTSFASPTSKINRAQLRGFIPETSLLSYDNDGDFIPTGWELDHQLDPYLASDGGIDHDGDGWSAYQEWIEGTAENDPNDTPSGTPFSNIVWTDLTDTSTTDIQGIGSTLEKNTTSSAWNAGATSTLFLEGDGEFRFGAASTDTAMFVGLNDFSQDANYTNLDYAFYLNNGGISIFENGSFHSSGGATYLEGDLLSIQRAGTEVRYLLNGTVIYTSTNPSSGDLFVDTSFASPTSKINRAQQRGFIPETSLLSYDNDGDYIPTGWELDNQLNPYLASDGSIDHDGDGWSAYQEWLEDTAENDPNDTPSGTPFSNIVWTDLTNASTTDVQGIGSTLEKNTTSSAWNAGATSTLYLDGDGEFRFGVANTDTAMFVGLNDSSPDANYTNLDYAFYLNNGAISIFENGSFFSSGGATYLEGDLLSMQRSGTEIRYLLNGVVIYTSSNPSSGNLFVDTSFASPTSKINRSQQRGFYDPNAFIDSDGDGMPDSWETANGFDPNDPADGTLDADGDGLSNADEYQAGTDPNHRDSDGDGFSDYLETEVGSDPLTAEVINDTLGELGPTGLTIFSPVLNFVAE